MSIPADVKAGSILFLPKKDDLRLYSDVLASNTESIEKGQYNHPVLIFAVNHDKTRVLALILTTFGNTPISTKFPDRETPRSNANILRIRRLYLPIYPAEHPDPLISLHLADDLTLNRNSYVKIETPVILETRLLRSLYVGPRRLKTRSFKELQSQVQFQIPDGFSITAPVVSPVADVARTQYLNRLYSAINERPTQRPSYTDTLPQHGITTSDILRQYHERLRYQSTTQSSVVRTPYTPPITHDPAPAAVYRTRVSEAEEGGEGETDTLLRSRAPHGIDLFITFIGLIVFVGLLGFLVFGVVRLVGWILSWFR